MQFLSRSRIDEPGQYRRERIEAAGGGTALKTAMTSVPVGDRATLLKAIHELYHNQDKGVSLRRVAHGRGESILSFFFLDRLGL